ncbi:hypothetical protein LIER_43594 [Lithospermum erythrorhizon]|uniref:Uncharacterized protein n=1 Tax=Lithospermum erythrorhizon TaxID=34254 RepID=A0AAV3QDF9_LITER
MSATMLVGIKLSTFSMFTDGTEEHIAAFQSQLSFQHPYNKVYYRAFPSSLTEFYLVPRADQKITVVTFIDQLRMGKFKKSLLKKRSTSLEEANLCFYKYIQIKEMAKKNEKGRGKHPMDETRQRSPKPKRRSPLDKIRAPDRGYFRLYFLRRSAFLRL